MYISATYEPLHLCDLSVSNNIDYSLLGLINTQWKQSLIIQLACIPVILPLALFTNVNFEMVKLVSK